MPVEAPPKTLHQHIHLMRVTSLDPRDKGDKFESLVLAYIKLAPQFADKFEDAWLWNEWPGRGETGDTGVDLVAKFIGSDDVAFIQCKFYGDESVVQKGDIDSFLGLVGKKGVREAYVFDTASRWSKNAVDALEDRVTPIQRIDLETMENSGIDWSKFEWGEPDRLVEAEKKSLRPHQARALEAVNGGFLEQDRGKLIMACGTGKTFTSLKIAEAIGKGGRVLFLAPSIQLISQSLTEWVAQSELPLRRFAVCSDVRVGRKSAGSSDEPEISTVDLPEPATTNAEVLAERASADDPNALTVTFSTYQSIKVIHEAQERGLPDFDLIICDEAHRTTGVTLAGADESHFVKVHDNGYIRGGKRLYMTATPRLYGEAAKQRSDERGEFTLTSMDDEALYGPEFHRLGFSDAVELDLLSDYKVLLLAVNEEYVSSGFQQAMAIHSEIKLGEAARLVGCWNGLAKRVIREDGEVDPAPGPPMRTAVAFAETIKKSKEAAAAFPEMASQAIEHVRAGAKASGIENQHLLSVEAEHVDGTMGIQERNEKLSWLKTGDNPNVCRVLTNARCLSEGVDVPALDAVMFLSPRASQVDVVQSVGRVMRKAPGKDFGYVILPVVVPHGSTPEETMADNKRFKVVWQVLQALRSHDDRFNATINKIELNTQTATGGGQIEVGVVGFDDEESERVMNPEDGQMVLTFPDEFRNGMYAKIVQKVGSRKYWEDWASDVAEIAEAHIARINGLLAEPSSPAATAFDKFLDGLRGNLNESVSQAEAVEMLAQHLITRPIFDALFEGYNFTEHNPVAQAMERMLEVLDEHALDTENETLEGFYRQVKRRIEGVDNAEGRQKILVELYNNFFAKAFKRTVDKLGIVYTPVEIVDFILRSADDVLKKHFGIGLSDEGVHILDGFTGTGTFMVRALQLGVIDPHDLARKYANELHANEILLLAYYIAAVNIETTYLDLTGEAEPFPGLVLTDTFQSYEENDRPDLEVIQQNNERIERQNRQKITVIVGNPPYSAGQDSANEDNANESYSQLDSEIANTYAARSTAVNKNSLYDSYIRAIKWASSRIGDEMDRGVIAYVTNGGWLDSNTADGMRKTLVEEFSEIHVFNLRGNQRTAGEQSRREGGKIFGSGSRATVAITVLVKDPSHAGPAKVLYTDVGDYLTREEKLAKVADFMSVDGLPTSEILPNEYGDWLNQRRDDFREMIPVFERDGHRKIFDLVSAGVKTNRDAWAYGFSRDAVCSKMIRLVDAYEAERIAGRRSDDAVRDSTSIGWSGGLLASLDRSTPLRFDAEAVRAATYRPFCRQALYFSKSLNERTYRQFKIFPTPQAANRSICVLAPRGDLQVELAALAVSSIPDVALYTYAAQSLPRYRFEPVSAEAEGRLFGETEAMSGPESAWSGSEDPGRDEFRRVDNITDFALDAFRKRYPDESIEKDDIFNYVYGVLHSPEYRETYAADLKKMLPRIPFVKNFRAFVEAGKQLMQIHLEYEAATPYRLNGIEVSPPKGTDAYDFYSVRKMRFGRPTEEQKANGERDDRSTILYNEAITLSGIPEAAYGYTLGARSAIEWILDRYQIRTDKSSGIVSDPNEWSREIEDPRYVLDLIARIVTVSIETVDITDSLPPLDLD